MCHHIGITPHHSTPRDDVRLHHRVVGLGSSPPPDAAPGPSSSRHFISHHCSICFSASQVCRRVHHMVHHGQHRNTSAIGLMVDEFAAAAARAPSAGVHSIQQQKGGTRIRRPINELFPSWHIHGRRISSASLSGSPLLTITFLMIYPMLILDAPALTLQCCNQCILYGTIFRGNLWKICGYATKTA